MDTDLTLLQAQQELLSVVDQSIFSSICIPYTYDLSFEILSPCCVDLFPGKWLLLTKRGMKVERVDYYDTEQEAQEHLAIKLLEN